MSKINYHIIVENEETKYLKTKASEHVIRLMLDDYCNAKEGYRANRSFQEHLNAHGIEALYDGTFGYFNLDEALGKKGEK